MNSTENSASNTSPVLVSNATMSLKVASSSVSDLDEVKKVTERLKLDPRRPSIVQWMARINRRGGAFGGADPATDIEAESLEITHKNESDEERFSRLNEAVEWIKSELVELQKQDHDLARQLISLRAEINRTKLQKSCKEHQALLDDVTLEMEERDEISDLCDLGPFPQFMSPLREFGITRMNLCSRRFSLS